MLSWPAALSVAAYLCHAGWGPLSLPCCHHVLGAGPATWALAGLLRLFPAASRLAAPPLLLRGHCRCCSPSAPVTHMHQADCEPVKPYKTQWHDAQARHLAET